MLITRSDYRRFAATYMDADLGELEHKAYMIRVEATASVSNGQSFMYERRKLICDESSRANNTDQIGRKLDEN